MSEIAKALESVAKALMSDVGDVEVVEPVDSRPVKTRRNRLTSHDEDSSKIAHELVSVAKELVAEDDPMAKEKVSKMWIALHRWTNKKVDALPVSAPIVIQLLDNRSEFDKRLRGKHGWTGRRAVEAVIEAMAGLYTVDAPPLKRLWRKYDEVEELLRKNRIRP